LDHDTQTASKALVAPEYTSFANLSLSGTECRSSCPRYYKKHTDDSAPYECLDECPAADFIVYTAGGDAGSDIQAHCADECPATLPKFITTTDGKKLCVPDCDSTISTVLPILENASNNSEYVKYFYLKNGTTDHCVRSCDHDGGDRIYDNSSNYKCMSTCPTSNKFRLYQNKDDVVTGEDNTDSVHFCLDECSTASQYFYEDSPEFVCVSD
jgi:hypothetical protein